MCPDVCLLPEVEVQWLHQQTTSAASGFAATAAACVFTMTATHCERGLLLAWFSVVVMVQGLLTSTVPCSRCTDLFAWGALVLIQSLDFVRMQVWVFESYMLAEDRDDLGPYMHLVCFATRQLC